MPISTLRTSPIGLVNKSDGSFRLIMHLSFPNGCNVNDFFNSNETSVRYTSFDEVIDMMSSLGKGARLGVQDIKSAFRLLPISPGDFDLLGIYFDGNVYVDKSLPFVCSIGCALFEKFSSFLQWLVVSSAGKRAVKHYLDDFIFGGSAISDDCLVLMKIFTELCNELGVPIAEDKTIHPTTRLTFLGFEKDTVDMVVRIPVATLIKLRSQLQPMTIKRKIKFKDFESLLGLLAFCSRAVPSSRAFLRRFYDVIASFRVKKPFFSVRITSEIRKNVMFKAKHIVGAKNNIADAPKVSTIGGEYTGNSPSGVHRPDLQTEIDRLIVSAVEPNTAKVYQQALRSFKDFRALFQFEDLWPIPLHHITNCIAYMSFTGTAASTVKSYISGLSFCSKINNYTDCFNAFVVRKLLEGMKCSQRRQKNARLPIMRDLLSKIYNVLPAVCHNDFETKLFQASFSLASFGFLRVGKLTADQKHASTQSHALDYKDIKINLSSIEIRLRSSNTDQWCTGTIIVIDDRPGVVCAVFALHLFIILCNELAFVQARTRPGGINLGLDQNGVRLWWLGKSGIWLNDLLNRIKLMLRYEEPQTYLVLHIGGNDLGEIKTGVLRNRLNNYLKKVSELLLNTTLVWSQVLPRLTWRYSADTEAMDRSRKRINSSLASYIIRQGGHYIRYPDISPNSTFICQDGEHLTDIDVLQELQQLSAQDFNAVLHSVKQQNPTTKQLDQTPTGKDDNRKHDVKKRTQKEDVVQPAQKEDDVQPPRKRQRTEYVDQPSEERLREERYITTTALNDGVENIRLQPTNNEERYDMMLFFKDKQVDIVQILEDRLLKNNLKFYLSVHIKMIKYSLDGKYDEDDPHFNSKVSTILQSGASEIPHELNKGFQKVFISFEEFIKNGSGWQLEEVLQLNLCVKKHNPLKGGFTDKCKLEMHKADCGKFDFQKITLPKEGEVSKEYTKPLPIPEDFVCLTRRGRFSESEHSKQME
ncbi:unnamed protein product [Mytilus coruscus]|uniref:Reverse transcriptase domain-containing protein n=1 Tax=Mytilus coruscus TaxID=42192 RepID=A0A6J8A7J1_MYTCO|nr:unnamed protein product [Mytilus coruscus]